MGAEGEQIAVKFLQRKGVEIVERNYRHGRGEIDIVARDRGVLVFVEVKTAMSNQFGSPEGWVDKRKQQQIARLASGYIQRNHLTDIDCRFDVVAVDATRNYEINYIQDAFWIEI